ncbi:MAG TPA: PEP/pyruvate-binding domain-containing protein [Phototrophicaceae bacterium]|nr:PEP/pyruvate-binding domain-containing protein [Phototrophicaceae bacterium]
MSALVRLREVDVRCGAKAATLGRLARSGIRVPDGVVVPDAAAAAWRAELPAALSLLGGTRFAVRSSADAEDGADASFAGQFDTRLDVPGEEVAEAVREVAAHRARAAAYADAVGRPPAREVAVLVQPMLRARAAGVAFTRHPVTGTRAAVVEAVRGLGEPLVAGRVSPERWQRGSAGRPVVAGAASVLTEAQARSVVEVAERVEALLGGAQDVEWVLDDDGVVWVLQARPVTGGAPAVAGPTVAWTGGGTGRTVVGTAAGPGTAQGRLRVVAGLDDFPRFRAGDVLVCRSTSPAWVPVLSRAAAVVTEVGGILAHAAIVARELGIPAVTDVPAATRLPDGAPVQVDGTAGTITLLEES